MNGAKQSLLIFVLILAIQILMAAPALDTESEYRNIVSYSFTSIDVPCHSDLYSKVNFLSTKKIQYTPPFTFIPRK